MIMHMLSYYHITIRRNSVIPIPDFKSLLENSFATHRYQYHNMYSLHYDYVYISRDFFQCFDFSKWIKDKYSYIQTKAVQTTGYFYVTAAVTSLVFVFLSDAIGYISIILVFGLTTCFTAFAFLTFTTNINPLGLVALFAFGHIIYWVS